MDVVNTSGTSRTNLAGGTESAGLKARSHIAVRAWHRTSYDLNRPHKGTCTYIRYIYI